MNSLKSKFGLFSLLTVFTLSAFLISCEQDFVPQIIEETQSTEIYTQNVKKERSELAKHLSIMIAEQPELNNVLKEMIDEEVEKGYYEREIFFNIKKDETSKLLNGTTLNSRLSSSHNEEMHKTIDYLSINDPGLAILMIGDKNSTEFNTRIYVDNGFDDSDPTSQIEYYENGVLGTHSISEPEPTALTFIVRESEAYLAPEEMVNLNPNNITKLSTVKGKELYVYGYNSDMLDMKLNAPATQLKKPQDINESSVESRQCDRDNFGGKEQLYAFWTSDARDPFSGRGEFIFDVVFGDDQDNLSSLRNIFTGVTANRWHYKNWDLFTWESNNDLDRMKYRIMEDDGGATYNFNITLSGTRAGLEAGGQVGVTYTDDDDFIGEAIIEYCDPIFNSNAGNMVNAGVAFLSLKQTGENITNGATQEFHNIRFLSTDNQYLDANNNDEYAYCDKYVVGHEEVFTIRLESDGTFAIKGHNGLYADVHVGNDARIQFKNSDPYCTDCRFKFEDAGDGYKAIKSIATGKYLASEGTYDYEPVRANRNSIGHWERWYVFNYPF